MEQAVSRLRIGVLGAGSIGCYVGGRLAAAGQDVVLVGRARVKGELDAHGVTVVDLAGAKGRAARVQIATEPDALADRDVVLCAVKSAHTGEAASIVARVAPRDAMVVSLQNGLRNADVLRSRLPGHTVLGAIVGFNVVPKGDGVFRQATAGEILIEGAPDPRLSALATALSASGVLAKPVTHVRAHQHAKLLMNLNNAVSALSDAPSRDLVLVAGYRRAVAAIVAEAIAVMRKAKIRPARLRGIPVRLFPIILRMPTALVKVVARAQLRIDPEARSSMWEDLSRGRLTEVDELNGEIVRIAEQCGAEAPLNRRIVELVHEVERGGKGSPKLGPEALWAALHA
jgi:2-dehydropantoate 2-reductase